MNYHTKNIIIWLINGLTIMLAAIFYDKIISTLQIQAIESRTLMFSGLIFTLLPMIISVNISERRRSWEVSYLFFWKKTNYEKKTMREIMLLGFIPIHETTLYFTHYYGSTPLEEIKNDITENITTLIPIVNGYVRAIKDAKKLSLR